MCQWWSSECLLEDVTGIITELFRLYSVLHNLCRIGTMTLVQESSSSTVTFGSCSVARVIMISLQFLGKSDKLSSLTQRRCYMLFSIEGKPPPPLCYASELGIVISLNLSSYILSVTIIPARSSIVLRCSSFFAGIRKEGHRRAWSRAFFEGLFESRHLSPLKWCVWRSMQSDCGFLQPHKLTILCVMSFLFGGGTAFSFVFSRWSRNPSICRHYTTVVKFLPSADLYRGDLPSTPHPRIQNTWFHTETMEF